MRGNVFFMVLFGGSSEGKPLVCRYLLDFIRLIKASFSSNEVNTCIRTKSCLAKKANTNEKQLFLNHFIIKISVNLFIIDKNLLVC